MPASGQTYDDSLRSQITRWLYENPGQHRPADISTGLGVTGARPRMKVHNEVARLFRDGYLNRSSEQKPGRKRPVTSYALAAHVRETMSVGGES